MTWNDGSEDYNKIDRLRRRVEALEVAIRAHRDQRGDDRCWRDDETLYAVLPEGFTPPAREVTVEIEYCLRYIVARKHPDTEYVSPNKLLTRYLDNHCANVDAEGVSGLCECQLCKDTRGALGMPGVLIL